MKVAAYSGIVMGTIFIIFGIIIPFEPPRVFAEWGIKNGLEYFVAIILVSYGLFRVSRAINLLKRSK